MFVVFYLYWCVLIEFVMVFNDLVSLGVRFDLVECVEVYWGVVIKLVYYVVSWVKVLVVYVEKFFCGVFIVVCEDVNVIVMYYWCGISCILGLYNGIVCVDSNEKFGNGCSCF